MNSDRHTGIGLRLSSSNNNRFRRGREKSRVGMVSVRGVCYSWEWREATVGKEFIVLGWREREEREREKWLVGPLN